MLEEMIVHQKAKLLELGRQTIPTLTPDDLLQPCDYPELENHPCFRFEEGVLVGMQTVQAALNAQNREVR